MSTVKVPHVYQFHHHGVNQTRQLDESGAAGTKQNTYNF